ncbi:unnamed protein product [Durusdinium trenchii]|uniref:Uncharacterized protein n=1 Tax=Durusdinium trenchii TaxID=1381693 RepID=A0ABP0RKM5_9DINO
MWLFRPGRAVSRLGRPGGAGCLGTTPRVAPLASLVRPLRLVDTSPARLGTASMSAPRELSRTSPFSPLQLRTYNIQKVINWPRIKKNVLEVETKQRTTKNRNHAEVLKTFRLSRFGWERRRARLRGGNRRRRSWLDKKNSKKIEYVHRVDMLKMIRTATYFKLRIRDFPKDGNPNYRETRAIVGSHFGT